MTSAVRLRASAMRDEVHSSPPGVERLRTPPVRSIGTGSSATSKLLLIFVGTRPECIKVAPVVKALDGHPEISPLLVNSGQHQLAVRACLAELELKADIELDASPALPNLAASYQQLRMQLAAVMRSYKPDLVLLQGDTLTAFSAACAARDTAHPIAHLEAGLRTDAVRQRENTARPACPWHRCGRRRFLSWHPVAVSAQSRDARLCAEGVPGGPIGAQFFTVSARKAR